MNKIFHMLLLMVVSLSTFSSDVFLIPFYENSNKPLVYLEDGVYTKGIYVDSFKKILDAAKIKYKLSPLPKLRARQNFWEGKSHISCCDNPQWRSYPKEISTQLFSKPFIKLKEFIIVRKDSTLDINDYSKLHFALFRGYSYAGDSSFKKISYLKENYNMLKFVELKRADAAIISEFLYLDFMKKYPNSNLKVAKIFSTDDIHIRVHKDKKYLLPVINKEISRLKKKKVFEDIIRKYTK